MAKEDESSTKLFNERNSTFDGNPTDATLTISGVNQCWRRKPASLISPSSDGDGALRLNQRSKNDFFRRVVMQAEVVYIWMATG
jgi:hypothetical protein